MKQETKIQNQILRSLGKERNVRIFRNNTGLYYSKDGRPVRTGLCIGSSDLIGFVSKKITQKDVGKTIAQFLAIEVKTPEGVATPQQINFIKMVHDLGGIGKFAHSVDEAEKCLKS